MATIRIQWQKMRAILLPFFRVLSVAEIPLWHKNEAGVDRSRIVGAWTSLLTMEQFGRVCAVAVAEIERT